MSIPIIIEKCVKNLCEVKLFKGLDQKKLTEVAKLCELIELAEGDFVVKEDQPATDFYILLAGEISVSKKLKLPNIEEVESDERILSRMDATGRPPVGETAIVGQTRRMATVRCITDCMFYRIETPAMLKLMNEDHDIAANTYRELSVMLYQRLETASTDVVKLTAALLFALED